MVDIRTATEADRQRCLALLETLGGSSTAGGAVFADLLTGERGEILVAVHAGRVVGMASVSYNIAMRYGGEYCQLEELIVDPEARGLSAGGALVQASIDRAAARGCAEYGLYLVRETEHNRPFYEKFGLTLVGSEMRLRLGDGSGAKTRRSSQDPAGA